MNGSNEAGAPRVSASVAGTLPPTVDDSSSLIQLAAVTYTASGEENSAFFVPSPNRKKPRCLTAPRPGNGSGFEARYAGLTVYRSDLESARVGCTPVYGPSVIARLTDR